MSEEERIEKVRRYFREFDFYCALLERMPEKKDRVYEDWDVLSKKVYFEVLGLALELYPDAPKDLMEDVKKRMEAYKRVKAVKGNRIPPLSLKQKFELLFKREGNENAK